MINKLSILLFLFILSSVPALAQDDEELKTNIVVKDSVVAKKKQKAYTINPLAPSKAAFYSAIVPGLGQVYNKQYWKVPIIYGAMGISLYYYNFNNKKYHEFRDAYRAKLAGREVTGELSSLSEDRLISGQRFHQRNRDLSMLITIGIYVLNIVEANVNAHLGQFNVSENLSLYPQLQQNEIDYNYNMGLTLNYKF
ncbi:DUF5683 domain-containing protein [uncultured Flavobacterium sp.]|uniref:DUF5683 domain-containing protein n=1 Tax=uncultured Flavobacterium sp. TaxID=165435 RepID=UPI000AEBCCCA|nr:DUF5683 domain-containing protein [uncultured Flavobacterium sp.]